jgi:hypothetical protein
MRWAIKSCQESSADGYDDEWTLGGLPNNGMHPTPHQLESHAACVGARVIRGVMPPVPRSETALLRFGAAVAVITTDCRPTRRTALPLSKVVRAARG